MNRIRLDANRMMADMLGDKGISRAELADMAAKAKDAYAQVEANRGKGMQGWMDLPYNQGDVVERIEATAKRVAQEFEAFVVLGIGGSACSRRSTICVTTNCPQASAPARACTWRTTSIPSAWLRCWM